MEQQIMRHPIERLAKIEAYDMVLLFIVQRLSSKVYNMQ